MLKTDTTLHSLLPLVAQFLFILISLLIFNFGSEQLWQKFGTLLMGNQPEILNYIQQQSDMKLMLNLGLGFVLFMLGCLIYQRVKFGIPESKVNIGVNCKTSVPVLSETLTKLLQNPKQITVWLLTIGGVFFSATLIAFLILFF